MATDIIAGSAGGIAMVIAGHPLDTVKVRLQTQSSLNPKYSGMFDCIKTTIKEEGAMGLYKGVQSPLIGVSALNAVVFFAYGQSSNYFRETANQQLTMAQVLYAGTFAGIAVSFVEGPVDLFKAKLQVQSSEPGAERYRGVTHAASSIWKNYGIRGVYQGIVPTLWRDVPSNAVYFVAYEGVKRSMASKDGELRTTQVLAAGSAAGVGYWLSIYPIDMIKTVVQTDHSDPAKRKYKGMWDAARSVYRQFGMKAFFKGITPCLVRSVPANAACFAVFELTKGQLLKMQSPATIV